MYRPQMEDFAAVYFQSNSLAVCVFSQQDSTINCGQILHFCLPDKVLLSEKLFQCSLILTNQPKNSALSLLQNKVEDFKAEIRNNSIFHLLSQLPFESDKIKNKKQCFEMMLQESSIKFKALGMLLYHLINFTVTFKRSQVTFQSISYWNDYIFQHLQATQAEINYLEITSEHLHPSLVKDKVQNTLGSSILKIYDSFLRIKGAKKYLKRLILNPTYNRKELETRLQTIQWMLKYMDDKKLYSKHFKNIYTVDSILLRFQRDKIQEDDWRKLIKSIQCIIELRKCLPLQNPPEIIKSLLDKEYWGKLTFTLNHLNRVIQLSPFGIKQGYDPRLKELKHLYFQMPRVLAEISKDQKWGMNAKLIFMPQIGYLVEIPHSNDQPQQNGEWQLKFTNCNGMFYSNQLTKNLDDEYGDINAAIKDIQTRILDELEQEINDVSEQLIDAYWRVSIIECMWGIGQLGRNMAPPKFSQEELIVINGWSMLLGESAVDNHSFSFHHEKGPSQRVFNSELNIVNSNYSNRCCLISGPNGAGKTIYMKQLGTMIYLAHCGFHVPASFAEIPLMDRIIVTQSGGSLYSNQAGFQRQLMSLSKVMNGSVITNKSLVLIDQIGLSQDYTIGLKMLYACIKYLSANNGKSFQRNKVLTCPQDHFNIPLTFIITHLTQLMTNQLIQENYYVRYLTMDVNNDFDFLFKLKPGLVKSGYGIKSAEGFIKSQSVIEKAYEFWNKLK